jgi:hyperosmotically inducible protein
LTVPDDKQPSALPVAVCYLTAQSREQAFRGMLCQRKGHFHLNRNLLLSLREALMFRWGDTEMKLLVKPSLVVLIAGAIVSSCVSPVTIGQRALEERSIEDIAKDNEIVIDVNELMAKYETVSVSTEIYEQRLVVYGLLDDEATLDNFRKDTEAIEGIKQLYWHVLFMTEEEQKAKEGEMLGFSGGLEVKANVEKGWLETEGIDSLNYRVAVGALGDAYVLGRAFTAGERDKALTVVRNVEGVTKVVDYVEVRPKAN